MGPRDLSQEKIERTVGYRVLWIILFCFVMSGCQSLQQSWNMIKEKATYSSRREKKKEEIELKDKKSSDRKEVSRAGQGYLKRGKKSVGGFKSTTKEGELLSQKLSHGEWIQKYKALEEKYTEERIHRQQVQKEFKELKRDYGKRIFDLETNLERANRDVEDYKNESIKSQLETIKVRQKFDRIRIELSRRKSFFDSSYPSYYEVRKGDNLWSIAQDKKIYNDPYKWLELYHANKTKIGDQDLIFPGQVLRIPRFWENLMSGMPPPDIDGVPIGTPKEELQVDTGINSDKLTSGENNKSEDNFL